MLIKSSEDSLNLGLQFITEEEGKHNKMKMDFGTLKLKAGEEINLIHEKKETALLLMVGKVKVNWESDEKLCHRNSCFDEGPHALHVSKDVMISIKAESESELLVQRTTNERSFDSKYYGPSDCVENIFGDGVMDGTARRVVRDIFNYDNAPYSNMVMGEVINYHGRWSSYPPHHHRQPEIYFYRFSEPQGFGCSIIGEDVYKIENNSTAIIDGGLVHPQVTAPGYGMYYCWMIRHLDNDPWRDRIDDPKHAWLRDEEAIIWNPKK